MGQQVFWYVPLSAYYCVFIHYGTISLMDKTLTTVISELSPAANQIRVAARVGMAPSYSNDQDQSTNDCCILFIRSDRRYARRFSRTSGITKTHIAGTYYISKNVQEGLSDIISKKSDMIPYSLPAARGSVLSLL